MLVQRVATVSQVLPSCDASMRPWSFECGNNRPASLCKQRQSPCRFRAVPQIGTQAARPIPARETTPLHEWVIPRPARGPTADEQVDAGLLPERSSAAWPSAKPASTRTRMASLPPSAPTAPSVNPVVTSPTATRHPAGNCTAVRVEGNLHRPSIDP